MAINPLISLASRSALYPIHVIVFIALLASAAYFHLLDIARNSPPSVGFRENYLPGADVTNVGTAWYARKGKNDWNWSREEFEVNVDERSHVRLALGQIQTKSSPHQHDEVTNRLIYKMQWLELGSDSNPCYYVPNDTIAPKCLTFAWGETDNDMPGFGVLLTDSSTDVDVWTRIIYSTRVDGVEWVLPSLYNGKVHGNAAMNMLWLLRSLAQTFSTTRELIKMAPTVDIIIMVIGYLTMHLTFVSLFLNMRTIGSKFWLGATVLISSSFSFLLALATVNYLGVPINMVLLSEGLPFLVVTVGFEKPFLLTKAVLQGVLMPNSGSRATKDDVSEAVREKGFVIVRDYSVEIVVLALGAASGVRGLKQFCFLAAWILGWDCLLLFTFYTAILSIKLEINRIKRHAQFRNALQEEGMSYRNAETVAAANDIEPPAPALASHSSGSTIFSLFGHKGRDETVSRFKLLMVSAFVIINLLNLCTLPFRPMSTIDVTHHMPFRPFALPSFIQEQITQRVTTKNPLANKITLTFLSPIFFKLTDPEESLFGRGERAIDGFLEGWTKSVGDPVISKWIVVVLCLSVGLNAWLLGAARRGGMLPDNQVQKLSKHHKSTSTSVKQERPVLLETLSVKPSPYSSTKSVNGQLSTSVTLVDEESDDDQGLSMVSRGVSGASRMRTPAECEALLNSGRTSELTDEELINLTTSKKIATYALEKTLNNFERAVKIRRAVISRDSVTKTLENSNLPYEMYDYGRVMGACCENVVGYMPLPLGIAGPIVIDDSEYWLPMATTEGVLVASTMRGCKAVNAGGGCYTVLTKDLMTRGPCVRFPTAVRAGIAKQWLDSPEGFRTVKKAFDSTSRFARLESLLTNIGGNYLYIRFSAFTGDGMGMNMISKGVEHSLSIIANETGFGDMEIVSISGNFCTDKKPAAVNWIEGRGKSVVAEAFVPSHTVKSVLKSSVDAMVELNISKNLVGSAIAGSVGGFNAHAANLVAAIFIATGQDPAQVVESSNCITLMEKTTAGDLHISVTLPCIEVGTIGGGTVLEPQSAMLDMLGVRGPHPTTPGENAKKLARIIAAGVLAGELSLCSALAAGHLVRAHMTHNRSAAQTPVSSRVTTPALAASSATELNGLKPLTALSSSTFPLSGDK